MVLAAMIVACRAWPDSAVGSQCSASTTTVAIAKIAANRLEKKSVAFRCFGGCLVRYYPPSPYGLSISSVKGWTDVLFCSAPSSYLFLAPPTRTVPSDSLIFTKRTGTTTRECAAASCWAESRTLITGDRAAPLWLPARRTR